MQRFYDRFHAKKDKAKQAKAKLTQIERIKRDLRASRRGGPRASSLGLPQPKPSARVVLELQAPALTVGSADGPAGMRTLVRDVDVVLERGEKVALLGANGSGKTTLVETVEGLRSLANGAAHLGHNTRVAYYSQQGRELDESATCLETVLPLVGHDEEQRAQAPRPVPVRRRTRWRSVWRCSPAESAAVSACSRCSSATPNFLLLDEPTNHLDMGSVEALADALEDYTGTILLVTHDRHLIDRVATRVFEIHDGALLNHLSAARYWEARAARTGGVETGTGEAPGAGDGAVRRPRGGGAATGQTPTGSRPAGGGRPARGASAPAGAATSRRLKESAEEARRRRARLRAAEAAVLRAEKRLGQIDAELAEPDAYADRQALNRLLDERGIVEGQLKREYAEWERLVDEAG